MTVFLIIIVVALFAITVWQLTKIFQLSRDTNSIDNSQVASDKDNKMQGNLMLAFGIAFYVFMLYSFWTWSDRALPAASSAHGLEYDTLLWISLAVIMVVQILTQGLLHYFAFKYQGRKGKKALFFADNDKLEFVWTIIPVIVLAGLIIYGLFTWSSIMNIDDENTDAIVIEIYGRQFAWEARYAYMDNTLGKANVRFIEGANTMGVDIEDPYAYDDVVASELHLPVGRPVIFKFRSQDVLHSAYFPHFRAQMNVVPGMITQFSFTPTVTTEEIRETEYMRDKLARIKELRNDKNEQLIASGGETLSDYEQFDYFLLCNKICGTAHYNMQMKVVVETEAEFNAWMAEQSKFSETIDKMQQPTIPVPAEGDENNEDVAQVQN
ncbi:cytochrome c oxidase subunit II [Antarcticibacterium sp. 1MA-6-2]|uniref:cytochrome c oxidase subunit II n=1 Tax=Antarcticibacterium sp. 1MA-6-2 TaxID=2908210 RepID=UPI001F36F4D8|nr:cytochrome c oxidase subunit II [Antarcticibacterium sp. 1MA-6-2]UJH90861.1 cytochrome c oxidase subunit II [Antarcticibacterium sp. 1MA-6-2]